jgi:hypothetical protein
MLCCMESTKNFCIEVGDCAGKDAMSDSESIKEMLIEMENDEFSSSKQLDQIENSNYLQSNLAERFETSNDDVQHGDGD